MKSKNGLVLSPSFDSAIFIKDALIGICTEVISTTDANAALTILASRSFAVVFLDQAAVASPIPGTPLCHIIRSFAPHAGLILVNSPISLDDGSYDRVVICPMDPALIRDAARSVMDRGRTMSEPEKPNQVIRHYWAGFPKVISPKGFKCHYN